MQVEVLSPEQWEQLLEDVPNEEPAKLKALIHATHGHHAGLSTSMAAEWLRGASSEIQGRVRKRLNDALMRLPDDGDDGDGPTIGATFIEVIPSSLLVMYCLIPLALQTCRAIERNILFGGIPSPGADDAKNEYRDYEGLFDKAFVKLTEDDDEAQRLFWDKAAFTLFMAAQDWAETPLAQQSIPESVGTVPSDVDGGTLYFIKTIEPKFENRLRTALPRILHRETTVRKVPLKQAGIRGIRMTRSIADAPDRLLSELVLPKILRLDRLINTGFLVKHRPPPLDERRDLLLVGLFHKSSATSAHAFSKAVWLDAVERLATLLVSAGLHRTDLVHLMRMDEHATTRVAVAVDASNPERSNVDAFSFGARERLAMLRTHGWLPGFLDANPRLLPPLPTEPRAATDNSYSSGIAKELERSTRAAFRGFPETAGATDDRSSVFEKYARQHIQLFLSDCIVTRMETEGMRFELLAQALGLQGANAQNLVVIAVPKDLTEKFRVLRPNHSVRPISGVDNEGAQRSGRDRDAVASDLSGALLRVALETFDG